jgi:hypothetical protein
MHRYWKIVRKVSLTCLFLLACGREKTASTRSESAAESGSASPPAERLPLAPGEPRSFALLELFTSEGCSSCPPADRELAAVTELAERTGRHVITLSFHVDYWNDLGWTDPFSDARYTARQQQYLRVFNRRSAYTPELVVNGSEEFVGSDQTALRDAMMRALAQPAKVAVNVESELREGKLEVRYASGGDAARALVQLALVQSRAPSRIEAGENGGLAAMHRNVVRDLVVREVRLPDQGEVAFELEQTAGAQDFSAAVIVSDPQTRAVWGAGVSQVLVAAR